MQMGRSLLVVLLVMGFGALHAQKVIRKSVLDPKVSFVTIAGENCFKVELSNTSSKTIGIQANIDGEYSDDLLLRIEEKGHSLEISAGFQPNFVQPNDKLSAHKIISISLQVQVPKNMKVRLVGTNTNVYAKGEFKNLLISLDDGSCNLDVSNGATQVLTRSGDIYVYTKGATIKTKNSFGSIEGNTIPKGKDIFDLTTITGDIHLMKTE